jgi:hypothetical protein
MLAGIRIDAASTTELAHMVGAAGADILADRARARPR